MVSSGEASCASAHAYFILISSAFWVGVRNATAHQVDEWVEVEAIEPLKNVYRRTVEALLP